MTASKNRKSLYKWESGERPGKTKPSRHYRHFTLQHLVDIGKIIRNSSLPNWAKEEIVKELSKYFYKDDPLLNIVQFKIIALSNLED